MELISTVSPSRESEPRRIVPLTYGIMLVAILFAEVLALSFRFDAQALVDSGGWVGQSARYLRYLPQALLAGAAVLAVLGIPRLVALVRGSGDYSSDLRQILPTPSAVSLGFLALHLLSFGGLATLSVGLLERKQGQDADLTLKFVGWVGLGMITLVFWLAAILPAGSWRRFAGKSSGVLVGTLGIAAGAVAAGKFTGIVFAPLGTATLWLVRGLLAPVAHDLVFDPSAGMIGTSAFSVEVAPECSGYEGIGLIWVFLAAYLWYFRRQFRFPAAFLLIPIATVVIWFANAVRIAALVLIGTHLSPSIALGGFHSQAGWLAFNGVALGLVALTRQTRFFAVDDGSRQPTIEPRSRDVSDSIFGSPTAAYLGPFLALVATSELTAAFSSGAGLDLGYPLRIVLVAAVLVACRGKYPVPRASSPGWMLCGLGMGVLVYIVWVSLEPWAKSSSGQALVDRLNEVPRAVAVFWLVAKLVGSIVTVPIAEELAFRGYLTRRLSAKDFTSVPPGRFGWMPFLVSSALFGVFHGRILAGMIAGMLFALAYRRKGDIREAIIAHATTNALIAASVLIFGAWSLWL